ncbi:MAG: zinc-ribbon domain-containing protein [Pirellulales bacterium]
MRTGSAAARISRTTIDPAGSDSKTVATWWRSGKRPGTMIAGADAIVSACVELEESPMLYGYMLPMGPFEMLIVGLMCAGPLIVGAAALVAVWAMRRPNPNLAPCPSCGRQIARVAPSCPHCGHPLNEA